MPQLPHLPALPHHLLAVAAAFALLLVLFAVRAILRARFVRAGTWLTLEVRGAVNEIPPPMPPWRRFFPQRAPVHSVLALRRLATRAARDPKIAGIVLRLG